MKKILNLFIISLFLIGICSVASAWDMLPAGVKTSPGVGDIMGQGKLPSDPHKTFRMVRFVADDPGEPYHLSADDVVIWDTASFDDGVTVRLPVINGSGDCRVAGIVKVAVTLTPDGSWSGKTAVQAIGANNWTWIQTYGYSVANASLHSAWTHGDPWCVYPCSSKNRGKIGKWTSGAQGTSKFGIGGFFFDTAPGVGSSDDVEIFIRLE